MSKDRRFGVEPLKDMVAVGLVGPRSARIWLRSDRPGRVEVRFRPEEDGAPEDHVVAEVAADGVRDRTTSVLVPRPDGVALRPDTRYAYRVIHEQGHELGRGSFTTFPAGPEETPDRFAFAVLSCNQPFSKDGSLLSTTAPMLRATRRCFEELRVRYVLMVGDQMYSDLPKKMSLFHDDWFARVAPAGEERIFDLSAEQIRALYQDRYRRFFAVPEMREIQLRWPCLPIVDDHDIVDNWGSNPDHQVPPWRALGEGAFDAYHDYQGSRISDPAEGRPGDFHYEFAFGNTATFVMDLRSERRKGDDGRLFSGRQRDAFEAFLARNAKTPILFVVLSVPAVHLPRGATKFAAWVTSPGEDFSDRWSTGRQVKDRDWLLRVLHDHLEDDPTRRIVLLSGDIHIGCVHRITWRDDGLSFFQLVSSALTNKEAFLMRLASKWLIRMNRKLSLVDGELEADVEIVPDEERRGKNPYTGLNFGIVEVENTSPDAAPKVRFSLYGEKGGEPVRVFRSDAF